MPHMKPEKIHKILEEYKKSGTVIFDLKDSFLSNEEFQRVEGLASQLPQEFIEVGDADEPNYVYVGRFMTDVDCPVMVNRPMSDEVIEILGSVVAMNFYKSLLDVNDLFIRRMQVNTMEAGCFVGHHLDVDSNPDYEFSIILQLGKEFGGGEFVVYDADHPPRSYKPWHRSITISNCQYPHEVKKVTSGKRISLVYFVSRHGGENRRENVEVMATEGDK
jgi:Rps23 Pro-64 3,4-dihydroxylase Tpa1-like proline 4-hydroxylase